jgi:transposase
VIPPGVRIFVCTEMVDMRLGFDRLAHLVRSRVGEDPEGGSLFVFGNRAANRVKCLWFDTNGYCLLYKRLHRAVFELPVGAAGMRSVRIDGAALARLLAGVERARHGSRNDRTSRGSVR